MASRITTVVDGALRRVHEAGRGEERLVAGFSPGLHVADAIRAFTAHRPEVDLDGEPMLDGRVPRAYSLEEKFELIASGRAVALVPVSVAGSYSRPDLFYLTVTDAPPVETCLVP
ncbi:hypothetical protein GCM10010359_49750 [Streptomyces morookaense]|nr:hypothetical protein GCM10010359_49750 [Streptomyces morookaense]